MKKMPWLGFAVHILRLLAIILIVAILVPRLFLAFIDLYNVLLDRDRVPSGHPMKVEAPVRDKGKIQ